jgi:hypothetical protein
MTLAVKKGSPFFPVTMPAGVPTVCVRKACGIFPFLPRKNPLFFQTDLVKIKKTETVFYPLLLHNFGVSVKR